jgi:hypothetical protein
MKLLLAGFALLMLFSPGHAQSGSNELTQLGESVKQEISKNMHGWAYRSVQPIQGSDGVILQQWQLNDIIVRVAITSYGDATKAQLAFKQGEDRLKVEEEATRKNRGKAVRLIKEKLPSLGDDGFVWDIRGSEAVAFRKGKFIVEVNVPSPADNKDVFFSRKVAHDVAKALN